MDIDKIAHFAHQARFESSIADLKREREDQAVFLKLGKAAIYKGLGRLTFDLIPFLHGYHLTGRGHEQLVYTRDDKYVIKVLRSSIVSSQEEAGSLTDVYQSNSDRCRQYLPDIWEQTSFYPMSIPHLNDKYVVVSIQDHITAEGFLTSPEQLASLPEELLPQVRDLVDGSRKLHNETGLYPDLLNPDNIPIVRDHDSALRLKIIDTIPLTPQRQLEVANSQENTVGQAMAQRLDEFDKSLALITARLEFRESAGR